MSKKAQKIAFGLLGFSTYFVLKYGIGLTTLETIVIGSIFLYLVNKINEEV